MSNEIDFVITWVDTNDEAWQESKMMHNPDSKGNEVGKCRYRDWGLLKYWFRAVERNASWVNKIHFVTCNQIPEWLNIDNPKLKIVNHEDFIPKENLPTFNSCAIEVNFVNIKDLSEKFVYFNDDTFLNKEVRKEDFFENDKPLDNLILNPLCASNYVTGCIQYNCTKVINNNFSFITFRKNNLKKIFNLKYGKYLFKNLTLSIYPYFVGYRPHHVPTAFLKSTFVDVWNKEEELLKETSGHKFRNLNDVSQWLFQFWQLASGNFEVRSINFEKYYSILDMLDKAIYDIKRGKHSLICLNDADEIEDFEDKKKKLIDAFEERYPEKSSFER